MSDVISSRRFAPLWLLALIDLSGTLSMHMFVPALPDTARSLGVSSAAVQTTIGVYFLSLALGQLILGPLSDALGRRPLLLTGLGLYVLGSVAAMLASSVSALLVARSLQAFGGSAGMTLGRAMVRDTHTADEAVRTLALLSLLTMAGPAIAPLIGSGLVELSGWRAVFAALVLMGVVTLALSWRMAPETVEPTGRVSACGLREDYVALLRSPAFVAFAVGGSCATTSMYAFVVAAPFIITGQLQHSLHAVGFALAMMMVGVGIGSALTRRLALRVGVDRLLLSGTTVSVLSASTFLGLALAGHLTLELLVGLVLLFALGVGVASPAAMAKVLSVDPRRVGSSAGLYGFVQMALGALFSIVVGWGSNPAVASAGLLFGATVVAQGCIRVALYRHAPS